VRLSLFLGIFDSDAPESYSICAHFDDPVNRDRQIEMFANPGMVAMGARRKA
jgi:hypothetical protein